MLLSITTDGDFGWSTRLPLAAFVGLEVFYPHDWVAFPSPLCLFVLARVSCRCGEVSNPSARRRGDGGRAWCVACAGHTGVIGEERRARRHRLSASRGKGTGASELRLSREPFIACVRLRRRAYFARIPLFSCLVGFALLSFVARVVGFSRIFGSRTSIVDRVAQPQPVAQPERII
jgi:hypothetical protein